MWFKEIESDKSNFVEILTCSIIVADAVKGVAKLSVLNKLIKEFRLRVFVEIVKISSKLC